MLNEFGQYEPDIPPNPKAWFWAVVIGLTLWALVIILINI